MPAITSGDVLARLEAEGKTAAGIFNGVRSAIRCVAAENHGDAAQGTLITWWTTKIGTVTLLEKMVLTDYGKVGIGTAIEAASGAGFNSLAGEYVRMARESTSSSDNTALTLQHYRNGFTSFCTLLGRSARGTAAAPRRTNTGDMLLKNAGGGWQAVDDATSAVAVTVGRASMEWVATENWTSTGQGAKLQFLTNAVGAAATPVLRLTIDENGLTLSDASNIIVGSTTGTKIGTATTQKIGFFNSTPVVQQADGAALTNAVTAGGTTDTVANFTDLSVYATDAAAIRNNIYQLARKVKIIGDALRTYGLLS